MPKIVRAKRRACENRERAIFGKKMAELIELIKVIENEVARTANLVASARALLLSLSPAARARVIKKARRLRDTTANLAIGMLEIRGQEITQLHSIAADQLHDRNAVALVDQADAAVVAGVRIIDEQVRLLSEALEADPPQPPLQ